MCHDVSSKRPVSEVDGKTGASRTTSRRIGWIAPALVIASVLFVLRDLAFGNRLSYQMLDPLFFWLPTHCFLGESIAAGEVPSWNPYNLGGIPFAADPQSGWMNLSAMALYAVLPCHIAFSMFFVIQPILAGLGIYWFLRGEQVSRAAAAAGGVSLALLISESMLTLAVPFSASLAWTAVTLACVSRYFHAPAARARLWWLTLGAIAWGQIAASHLSHGLVVGTGAVVAYGLARTWIDVRARKRRLAESLLLAGVLLGAMLLVNLAFFWPRLAYVPRTTVGAGYARLAELQSELRGLPPQELVSGKAVLPAWPLNFARVPGSYVGAIIAATLFAGLWSRRHRPLVIAFSSFAAAGFAASLQPVAEWVGPVVADWPFGDFYIHAPVRFTYAFHLALPIMAGFGIEAWREHGKATQRLLMLLPGTAAGLILPGATGLGGGPGAEVAAAGAGVTAVALAASARWPVIAVTFPVILAVELSAAAWVGQHTGRLSAPAEFGPLYRNSHLQRLAVPVEKWMRQGGRVLKAVGPPGSGRYLSNGTAQKSMLYKIEDLSAYNPVQPLRFWMFNRASTDQGLRYNVAVFPELTRNLLELFDVRWIRGHPGSPPVRGATPVKEGTRTLYERRGPSSRALVIGRWTVAKSPTEALEAVAEARFDSSSRVIVETPPEIAEDPSANGTATYESLGPGAARVTVRSTGPALVLVKNTHDPNWTATVDGEPADLLVADYVLQSVPVPPGRHVIDLRYHDPTIGYGLIGSALVLLALIAAWVVAGSRAPRYPFVAESR